MTEIGEICEPARARAGRSGGRQARVAMRAAPLADDVRPVRAGMPGGQYKPLSEEGVRQIHEAALDAYLEDTAAGLTWASAQALGAGPGTEAAVRAYGWAMGLANFLRAVPELESRGRIPLLDGRPEALAALAQRGLDRLAAGRGKVPAAARPALIACHNRRASTVRCLSAGAL